MVNSFFLKHTSLGWFIEWQHVYFIEIKTFLSLSCLVIINPCDKRLTFYGICHEGVGHSDQSPIIILVFPVILGNWLDFYLNEKKVTHYGWLNFYSLPFSFLLFWNCNRLHATVHLHSLFFAFLRLFSNFLKVFVQHFYNIYGKLTILESWRCFLKLTTHIS